MRFWFFLNHCGNGFLTNFHQVFLWEKIDLFSWINRSFRNGIFRKLLWKLHDRDVLLLIRRLEFLVTSHSQTSRWPIHKNINRKRSCDFSIKQSYPSISYSFNNTGNSIVLIILLFCTKAPPWSSSNFIKQEIVPSVKTSKINNNYFLIFFKSLPIHSLFRHTKWIFVNRKILWKLTTNFTSVLPITRCDFHFF